MRNDQGDTALHLAVKENNEEMEKFLLKQKDIEINCQNTKGKHPYIWQ